MQETQAMLLGASAAMKKLNDDLKRVSAADITVLLQGETGTGKSTFAAAVHQASARAAAPFEVLDCAAIAPSLIESALFGHEKGAFTGADRMRVGALEAAGAGTLFIDEITELAADQQPKLLMALEAREFRRLGSHAPIAMKCRVVAASQRDLAQQVKQGSFRRDLYFRIAVATINVPRLSERAEDIPVLCDHFFKQVGYGGSFSSLPESVRTRLLAHDWPGNLRELRNVAERLSIDSEPAELFEAAHQLGKPSLPTFDFALPYRRFKQAVADQYERDYVEALLARAGDNVTLASQLGQMNRRHLHLLIEKHSLRRRPKR